MTAELATSSPQNNEFFKELLCPVCHELFKEPAMLQCAHHVCMFHLGAVAPRDRLACPVCNDVTVVPEGGIAIDKVLQLFVNRFAAKGLHEATGAPRDAPRCGMCEENTATKHCVQCNGYLCEECVANAHSKGFFKSHKVIDLEIDIVGTSSSLDMTLDTRQHMLCDIHTEEKLNFYCLDCRRAVCSHCLILGDHKGHQQTPIDQAAETGKETLNAWVDKLNQRITAADELLNQLKESEKEMCRGAEMQRNTINTEMDHLRELIETKRHQLISKSALEEKQKKTLLDAQLERAKGAKNEASALVCRSEGLLALPSEHAFLAVVLPLIQDMKKCAGQVLDSGANISVTFRPLSTDAQVRTLGDLDLGHPRQPQLSPQPHVQPQVAASR